MKANRHIYSTKQRHEDKISIVIPAAGIGHRMKTSGVKSLLKVHNKNPILDRQIAIFNKIFPNYELILVGGFDKKRLFKNTPREFIKVENPLYEHTNVARSMEMGIQAATTNNVLVVYSDLIFETGIFNHFATNHTQIFVSNQHEFTNQQDIGCIINKGYVENLCWGLPNKWSQILYLIDSDVSTFLSVLENQDPCL